MTIIDNNSTLKNNRLRIYNSKKQDYGYITPYYFNDYETLIKRINNNDTEKWLIFVQSESDGIRLFITLSELCIETAFISVKTVKKKKKYNGQAAYQQIIEYQHFNYKVLIATSVIDCGVSIIDKDVCNIVIDNCDKTTFLQMLGRVRVENQKINLYIKYYGAKQINYHQNIMRCDFINIVLFSLIGEAEVVYDMYAYWKARFKYLSRIEVENAITNAAKRMSKTAIYYIYSSTPPLQYTNEKYGDFQKRAIHVEYSKTAMVKLLYSLYEFEKAYARKDAKEYENNEKKTAINKSIIFIWRSN